MDLKELLGEELATQVESKLGDKKLGIVNDGSWLPKSRLDEKIEEIKVLKGEVEEYSNQLNTLKESVKGNEELTNKIQELQALNENTRNEYEAKIKQTQIDVAIKMALNGKVHDYDIVKSLINTESIELNENGEVSKGLEEQVKILKESKGFLFTQEEVHTTPAQEETKPTAKMSVGNHNGDNANVNDDVFANALSKLGL